MSLEEFYYVSQIMASTAVLASVIYLALQTRQTSRNQRAQLNQARQEWIRQSSEKAATPQFAPTFRAGLVGDPSMDDEQVYQFVLFAMSELQGFEEVFRQWRDGMIDENRWRSTQFNLKRTVTWPGSTCCSSASRPRRASIGSTARPTSRRSCASVCTSDSVRRSCCSRPRRCLSTEALHQDPPPRGRPRPIPLGLRRPA